MTNQEKDLVVNISPYEKLQNYKEELQKINQYNQEILENLEQKISDSDIVNLEQIHEEIEVLKRVINDNKVEIEQINQKLSAIEPTS